MRQPALTMPPGVRLVAGTVNCSQRPVAAALVPTPSRPQAQVGHAHVLYQVLSRGRREGAVPFQKGLVLSPSMLGP